MSDAELIALYTYWQREYALAFNTLDGFEEWFDGTG